MHRKGFTYKLFKSSESQLTCKCVMLRSMFIADVSQFSETYL